jgi:hypothetical protein
VVATVAVRVTLPPEAILAAELVALIVVSSPTVTVTPADVEVA